MESGDRKSCSEPGIKAISLLSEKLEKAAIGCKRVVHKPCLKIGRDALTGQSHEAELNVVEAGKLACLFTREAGLELKTEPQTLTGCLTGPSSVHAATMNPAELVLMVG